ncbi:MULTISPECIES: TIGR02444 family protein [unclassified Rhizobium]|uniref:TIGR02444 family protein n=1 Tax=unclassified Rhizobium TaxID=2613769 RepID=UPI001ADB8E84|nr:MULTISPECIES: TIGR02444 family protein [unclassified Rhizobium]MBO9123915.1 TIGR02444 family protein [Rhizobium sp. 16-488-2b]MBO9174447.1 TIGR02444 family protein [Rhizobium sp. 16-488-2a]
MQQTGFTTNVWPNIILLYADSRIAQLCLSLQDEFDADVPVLLLLVIADRRGMSCEHEAFDKFLADAASWRELVVRPLRTLRRAMKGHCAAGAETALRGDIKRIELQAERVHVARLAEAFPVSPARGTREHDLADRYLIERGVPGEQRRDCLSLFDAVITRLAKIACPPDHQHTKLDPARKTTAS